jgi:hypothetical protein
MRHGQDEDILFSGITRFNSRVFGLILGLLSGSAIFVATNWLLIKGGRVNAQGAYVVGPHLQLLGQFFIGYKVSFFGSLVGFVYGFALGTLCGATIGWIYNKIVDLRS